MKNRSGPKTRLVKRVHKKNGLTERNDVVLISRISAFLPSNVSNWAVLNDDIYLLTVEHIYHFILCCSGYYILPQITFHTALLWQAAQRNRQEAVLSYVNP